MVQRQYERQGIALSLLAQILLGTDSQHEGAGGGSLPRSHRRDACSSPNLGDGIINKMHGIDKNRAIASVLYTSALTDDEIQRVLNWLTARYLT